MDDVPLPVTSPQSHLCAYDATSSDCRHNASLADEMPLCITSEDSRQHPWLKRFNLWAVSSARRHLTVADISPQPPRRPCDRTKFERSPDFAADFCNAAAEIERIGGEFVVSPVHNIAAGPAALGRHTGDGSATAAAPSGNRIVYQRLLQYRTDKRGVASMICHWSSRYPAKSSSVSEVINGKALFHLRFRKLPMAPGMRCRTSVPKLQHFLQRDK